MTRWRINRFREFLCYCDEQPLTAEQEKAIQERVTERRVAVEELSTRLRSGGVSGMALLACIADPRLEAVWREVAVWDQYRECMNGSGAIAQQLRLLFERIDVEEMAEDTAA